VSIKNGYPICLIAFFLVVHLFIIIQDISSSSIGFIRLMYYSVLEYVI